MGITFIPQSENETIAEFVQVPLFPELSEDEAKELLSTLGERFSDMVDGNTVSLAVRIYT